MTWLDDLQRRLVVAGARSLGEEFVGQVGKTIRGERHDVWDTATTEPETVAVPPGHAPECAWCPVCRAIRLARGSSPDLASRVSETAAALMSAAQDAVAALDAALARRPSPAPGGPVAEHGEPVADAPGDAGPGDVEPGDVEPGAGPPPGAVPQATQPAEPMGSVQAAGTAEPTGPAETPGSGGPAEAAREQEPGPSPSPDARQD